MSFNKNAELIFQNIQVQDDDSGKYNEDYERIRNYVIESLCEACDFKLIFGGTDLLGESVRYISMIPVPKKKNIMLVLNMPGEYGIKAKVIKEFPGFVILDYSKGLSQLRSSNSRSLGIMERLVDLQTGYLNKIRIQDWLHDLFERVFKNDPEMEGAKGDKWPLQYWKDGVNFKVLATLPDGMEILLNFVSGIKLYGDTWPYSKKQGLFKNESDYWYACPITGFNPNENKNANAFQVSNPRAEAKMLNNDDANWRKAYCLLKSFLTKKKFYKIKNYYLKTCFLFYTPDGNTSIQSIFFFILWKLVIAFRNGCLRYYWDNEMNLLMNFSSDDLKTYQDSLQYIYKLLHWNAEDLNKLRSHFWTPSKFNSFLEKYHSELQVVEDFNRGVDYGLIRNYVINKLCEAPDFKSIFGGTDLFGNTSTHIPVEIVQKKDILMVLNMPATENIKVELSKDCAGFVTLGYSEKFQQLCMSEPLSMGFIKQLVDPQTGYINKVRLEDWLADLFKGIFRNDVKVEGAEGNKWSLKHWKHDCIFSVIARSATGMEITVDFVFGIKLYGDSWPYCKEKGIFQTGSSYWYACPISSFNADDNKEATEFQVANPRAELKLLGDSNWKSVLRILKSFRDKNKLYKINNYFLTTLILIKSKSQGCYFLKEPIDIISIHILTKLKNALEEAHLPNYWDVNMNLLDNIDSYSLLEYKKKVNQSFESLKKL